MKTPRAGAKTAPHPGRKWLWIIPTLAVGLVATLAVFSFSPADNGAWDDGRTTHNFIGPVGHALARFIFGAIGVSAYGVGAMMFIVAVLAVLGRRISKLAAFGWMLTAFATSTIAHLVANPSRFPYAPGGALGRIAGEAARGAFSLAGSLILLGALLMMAILLATRFAAGHAFQFAAVGTGRLAVGTGRAAAGAWSRWRRARLMRAEMADEEPDEIDEPEEFGTLALVSDDEEGSDDIDPRAPVSEPKITVAPAKNDAAPVVGPVVADTGRIVLPDVPPDSSEKTAAPELAKASKKKAVSAAAPVVEIAADAATDPGPVHISVPPPMPKTSLGQPVPQLSPEIVMPKAPPKPTAALPSGPRPDFRMMAGKTGFMLPSAEAILEGETQTTRVIDRVQLQATAEKLRQKLIDLGVTGEVTEIRPGPVVTMYEFRPAAGIKLSRIASLSDDLAMAMEALRVRIVAPIPGKGVVGFEVPNKTREMVFLKEVVEQDAFQKSASRLNMAVGKDIEGMPYVSDLAKMPHLLIAGTTGSGKSVGVNAMLVSMLMRATPEELRFIMVDPKMLELSIYEGIPHLLLPVVTDPKKAALSLRWGVEEMERRYALLAGAGVRNITQYNKLVDKEALEALYPEPGSKPKKPVSEDEGAIELGPEEPKKKLPFIVIVIDELADLMMVAAKDVEVYIARLAQMARAAGIHLMVATQRPSTDVLTGVIKANFPSRMSFQVASRHDSGTIINTPGAENLLGQGDMLILPPGTSSLVRVHGAYVSEAEINKLTSFWKAQGTPVYDPEILRPRDDEGSEGEEDDSVADELYDQAIAAVGDMKQVSISLLQRKMRIGYNRSARMIERMERDGIVGPADGAKPRDVLIRPVGEMEN